MNGLEVDLDFSIIVTNGKAILVSSELAGGIHGNNSLGGNSLTDVLYLVASLAHMRRRPIICEVGSRAG